LIGNSARVPIRIGSGCAGVINYCCNGAENRYGVAERMREKEDGGWKQGSNLIEIKSSLANIKRGNVGQFGRMSQ